MTRIQAWLDGGADGGRTTGGEVSAVGTQASESRAWGGPPRQQFATILIGRSRLLLEGLRHILEETDFEVVALGDTLGASELPQADQHQAVLLILDPGHDLGVAIPQIQIFKQHCPEGRVALLADIENFADIATLFRAGANACFRRDASTATILKSLELVMLGETLCPSSILPAIFDRSEASTSNPPPDGFPAPLSAQEQRILNGLSAGHPNKVIANELGIADSTVKVHVRAILRKLGVHNRTEAAIWAMGRPGVDGPAPESEPLRFATAVEPPPAVEAPAAAEPPRAAEPLRAAEPPPAFTPPPIVAERLARRPAVRSREVGPPAMPMAVSGQATSDGRSERCISATMPKSALRQAQSDWRSERRIAEDEERHNAIIEKVQRLRELRMARESELR